MKYRNVINFALASLVAPFANDLPAMGNYPMPTGRRGRWRSRPFRGCAATRCYAQENINRRKARKDRRAQLKAGIYRKGKR